MARVLLVDDDPGVHDTIGPFLRHARHEFRSAMTGREALAIARDFDPDVALVDIKLPDISGVEVIRVLQQEMPWVASVAITGVFLYENATEALNAGACAWLDKPVWGEEILEAIHDVLRKRERPYGRELHLEPSERHHLVRLAEKSVKFVSSPRDYRKLSLIGRYLGDSSGELKNWCETAKLAQRPAERFRDFTRGLRAIYRLQHEPGTCEEGLLDIKDERSLRKFRLRGGGTRDHLPASVEEYLDKQQFIADADFVAAVRQILASTEIRLESEEDVVRCQSTPMPRTTAVDGVRRLIAKTQV